MPRILISHHIEVANRSLGSAFEHAGYEVLIARSSQDIEDCGANFDFAILDDSRGDWIGFLRECDTPVVALVDDKSDSEVGLIVSLGAVAVLDATASPETVVLAVRALEAGHSLIPTHMIEVVARANMTHELDWLTSEERNWLGSLARGRTIVDLAVEHALSEREMYRNLHALYGRIGVTNRAQAIAKASALGLIDPQFGSEE